jgi:hypothetical protein
MGWANAFRMAPQPLDATIASGVPEPPDERDV